MPLPRDVNFEALVEQLTKMYKAVEKLVFVRRAQLGGEGQGEFKEVQDQMMSQVGISKSLLERFKAAKLEPDFNLETFASEEFYKYQTAARGLVGIISGPALKQIGEYAGANVNLNEDVEIELNGEMVRVNPRGLQEELAAAKDNLEKSGVLQTGSTSVNNDENKVLASTQGGGNIKVNHDTDENEHPWSVAGRVAPGQDKHSTIQSALNEFNSLNNTNFVLVNKNGSLNIYDGDTAITSEQQKELNKIMISQASGGTSTAKASEAFWSGLVSSGYIEGDPKYYSSGQAKPEEYRHAFKTALTAVDATGDQATKDKFWSSMVSEGLIKGDSSYYATGKATTEEYNHALNVASGITSGATSNATIAPSNPIPVTTVQQQHQASITPTDPNPPAGSVVLPQQVVNPAVKSFWEGLVASGHIQGDPEYYYSGKANEGEYKHAFNTALASVDATNNQDVKDKFWSGMVSAGYVEGDPLYYSRAQAGTAEYNNAINVASGTAETRAFWEGLVASGSIQGDPEYYYSGKASPDEYKHAFKTAWNSVQASGDQAAKNNFWSGMVSSGYIEGDSSYYSSGQAQASEYDHAFNVAGGVADTVASNANSMASNPTPPPSPSGPSVDVDAIVAKVMAERGPEAWASSGYSDDVATSKVMAERGPEAWASSGYSDDVATSKVMAERGPEAWASSGYSDDVATSKVMAERGPEAWASSGYSPTNTPTQGTTDKPPAGGFLPTEPTPNGGPISTGSQSVEGSMASGANPNIKSPTEGTGPFPM
jgi:hypothetical protein